MWYILAHWYDLGRSEDSKRVLNVNRFTVISVEEVTGAASVYFPEDKPMMLSLVRVKLIVAMS